MHLYCFSEDRQNRLLHCDWKTVKKTARQAKVTDYLCNLLYHSSSNFHHTSYLIFVVGCNNKNQITTKISMSTVWCWCQCGITSIGVTLEQTWLLFQYCTASVSQHLTNQIAKKINIARIKFDYTEKYLFPWNSRCLWLQHHIVNQAMNTLPSHWTELTEHN